MPCYKVSCVAISSILSFFSFANAQSVTGTHALARNTKVVFEPAAGTSEGTYITRDDGLVAYFTPAAATISIPRDGKSRAHMEFRLLGTERQVTLRPEEKLSSYSNYLIGPDARNWRTHVDNYAGIRYESIYPGIDLVYYGNGNNLEHDFIVSPGAQPGEIAFRIEHADKITITPGGDLQIDLGGPLLVFKRPLAYQQIAGRREQVQAAFVRRTGTDTIGFALGAYDHSRQLIIDPVLTFATYLDGSQNDAITGTTTDAAGNVYVTGTTSSSDFPAFNAPAGFCNAQCTASTESHAFVSKLDPTGQTLIYSTFIGGSNGETGGAIAVDSNGNIIVSGTSNSSDFPQAGSFVSQASKINVASYFMASITADGTAFNYAGLLGSQGIPGFNSGVMALDSAGNAYLSGDTESASFPITAGTLAPSLPGFPTESMFISQIAPTGALVYSTILPGALTPDPTSPSVDQFTPWGIAIDSGGNAVVAGNAGPGLPTTAGVVGINFPLPTNIEDVTAGFVLKLNPTASALVFASYVPGVDNIHALAVDGLGNMFVTGQTNETNLAVSATAFQKTVQPGQNCTCNFGYVLELDSQAQSILNASYLTGTTASINLGTSYTAIALDSNSNIVVAGNTASSDVPLKNPLVSQFRTAFSSTPSEGYIAELSADFSTLLFGSFLSGANAANFTALTIAPADNAILAGTTFGNDFPTTPAAFQTVPPPPSSPFVSFPHTWTAKIDLAAQAPSVCFNPPSLAFGDVLVATSATQILNVTNCGNAPLQINTVTSSLASVTTSQSCGAVAPGSACPVQVTFSPVAVGDQIGTLTFADNASIPSQVIGVSGTGGVPQIFFPPTFAVSELIVGTQQEFFLQFENTGNGNWIVNSVTATGDFTVDNQCTAPLPPVGATFPVCQIGIIFAPTQPGLRTGTLTITDNAAGSPHVISLTGNALSTYPTPSIVSVTPVAADRLLFGLQIAGSNFLPASQVFVNGSPRVTRYEGEGFLTAALQASDVATIGELPVTVSNPTPGGGVSNTFTATIYGALRNISILHSVFDPHSGLIYASVSATSTNFAGELIAIDPSTAQVVNEFSIGNGPNQLAISDDGSLLYVGLDGDGTVAQMALPAGTINFAVVLGTDPDFGTPLVADALRVLPGLPHSWAATICGTGFIPCGLGVSVFDDSTKRATAVSENQLDADSLLFVGNDATTLYATTFNFSPSTFWKFSIDSSGITETSAITNFGGQSPGGAELDSDGTLIYTGNGQVIDPATVTIKSNLQGVPFSAGLRVDVLGSRIYFAGGGPSFGNLQIASFDLASEQRTGALTLPEFGSFSSEIYRWGTNGLAVANSAGAFILRSSLTGPVPPAQFSVFGLSPASIVEGSPDLALTIGGTGFAAGDTVSANGVSLTANVVPGGSRITTTIPSALLASAGNLQVTVTTPDNHIGNLVLIIAPTTLPVAAVSASSLNFAAQLVATASTAQVITVVNNGASALVFNSIAASGDFSQTNNCSSVVPGSSCSISVTFKPTAGGNRSGTLTINDNGASSPQVVNLSGIASAFAITANSSSATVAAGKTAVYTLNVNAPGGLSGPITFSCSNLPANASCSFNPASASLSGNSAPITVSIATARQTASLVHSTGTVFAFLVFPFGLVSLGRLRWGKRGRVATMFFGAALLGLLFLVAGCGGGSGASGGGTHTVFTPAGAYTVTVTANGGGTSQTLPLTLNVQ